MDAETSNKIATAVQIKKVDKLIEEERAKGKYETFVPFEECPQSLANHYLSKGYKVYWSDPIILLSRKGGIRITWYTKHNQAPVHSTTNLEEETKALKLSETAANSAIIC